MYLLTHQYAASGLLWLAEVIEENTKLAKIVGMRLTYVSVPARRVQSRLQLTELHSNLGSHGTSRGAVPQRRATIASHCILCVLSPHLPAKLQFNVAHNFPDVNIFHRILHLGCCGSLFMVLSFCQQGKSVGLGRWSWLANPLI